MAFETNLTKGNCDNNHFYITDFIDKFPKDIIGGNKKEAAASKTIRLEFESMTTDTDIPVDGKTGKPRGFFRDRTFVKRFFEKTGAKPGDTVLLDPLGPYRLRISLRRSDGTVVTE